MEANFYEKYFGSATTEIFLPDPLLRRYIVAYNFFGTHFLPPLFIKPIPNGLLELIMHFGDSYLLVNNDPRIERFKNFVVGLYELDYKTKVQPGAFEYYQGVCIRFTYEGINTLLRLRISDSLNSIVALEQLYGNRGKDLHDKLEDSTDNRERANFLDVFFTDILSSKQKKNNKISIIYEYLHHKTGAISVDDMAYSVGLSYRTIHRVFRDELGVCPKEYLKIIRFNNVCRLLVQYPVCNLQDIVHFAGYYDQAHFIHDFKNIMKISPMEFLKQSNGKFYLTRPFYVEEEDAKKSNISLYESTAVIAPTL
jgi:AraC-like DNA-binding protein